MRKLIFMTVFGTLTGYSQQETSTYAYGHNGIELIAKNKTKTIIISTFNSKPTIKEDIAQKVFERYLNDDLSAQKTIQIETDTAKVSGYCTIRTKNNLTALDFYYEKVIWDNGEIEIYKHKKM